MSIAVTSLKIESVFGKSPATRVRRLICVGTKKMTWEELQAVKNHQHYDSYYEAN